MNNLECFTNLYSVSKTLRFELKPIGNTLVNINKNGLLKDDLKKSQDYKAVKQIIDDYHRFFIDDVLSKIVEKIEEKNTVETTGNDKLEFPKWNDYANEILEYQKNKSNKERLDAIQKDAREKLIKFFEDDSRFKSVTASTPKDMLKDLLPIFLANDFNVENKMEVLKTFDKFATYFAGFQENRKNIYSAEAKSTSIAFRIVHENFPKFLQNIQVYNKLKNICPDLVKQVEQNLKNLLEEKTLDEVFSLDFFNYVLAQGNGKKQRGIDFYNQVIGGISSESGSQKQQGFNEFINQYWQQHPAFAQQNKSVRFIPLFKQILSDRSTLSFVIATLDNDIDLKNAIKQVKSSFDNFTEYGNSKIDVFTELETLIGKIEAYSQQHLFISAKDLSKVSQVLFGKWDELQIRMNEYANTTFKNKAEKARWVRDIEETNEKRTGGFSFEELDNVLAFSSDIIEPTSLRMKDYFGHFDKSSNAENLTDRVRVLSLSEQVQEICHNWEDADKILNLITDENKLREQKENIEKIKLYLDSVQDLLHRIKPLAVSPDMNRDSSFYFDFDQIWECLKEILPLYNKVRNYLTKKVFDIGKYKLNFASPTLANGWDANKENDNSCVIFIKDGNYYLGIINTKKKLKFENSYNCNGESCYQKMIYKYFKDVTTMIPKCSTQLKDVKKHFETKSEDFILKNKNFDSPLVISKEVYELNNPPNAGKKKFQIEYLKQTKDKEGYTHALKTWIDFCMRFLKSYNSTKTFDFSSLGDCRNFDRLDDFYNQLNTLIYRIDFVDIPESFIDTMVNDGQLYLFQIYNKDFSEGTTGTPNMHTLYWKALFDPKNLNDVVYKLDGGAELFYREQAIKDSKPAQHIVGEKIINRTTIDYESIKESIHNELFQYVNGKKTISELSDEARELYESGKVIVKDVHHTIIKDRRYTQAKFFFHVPITINFKKNSKANINENVRAFLKNNPDVNIIGLDRGERHLIYLTLINQKGEILCQKTFNTVARIKNDESVLVDYHNKLKNREKERDEARKSWQTIGKIAELKEGYLSAVIHEIVQMMIQYNAIIVMEDLNFGFKRGRFHVERQVYQKFEKMLIDKLNYLVFKNKKYDEVGGVLKGYQLTEKFKSFSDLGKQSGFLFYVPAGYTSKIDPTTGFANMFSLKGLTNQEKKQEFFSKFESIVYDKETNSFAFTFDYKQFGGKGAEEMAVSKWTVYSRGNRIAFSKKEGISKKVSPTENLKKLFDDFNIKFLSGENLLPVILQQSLEIDQKQKCKFYDELYRMFILTLQMRNSNAQTEEDYIASPVKNHFGEFYNSDNEKRKGKNKEGMWLSTLPVDADANGAFHIALKGLLLLQRFNNTDEHNLKGVDIKISNKEWFEFRQKS